MPHVSAPDAIMCILARVMRASLRSLNIAAVAAVLSVAASASAEPSPRECIAAADRGQSLQRQHKLIYAREALRTCAATTCPSEVQRACIQWLDSADKAQPTLAFSVTTAGGDDIPDVRVTVDDQPFVSKIMGAAVEIDPGEHTFHFVAPGYEPLTRKVVIVEGEKTRRVKVILDKSAAAKAADKARDDAAPPTETAPPEHASTQATAGVIVLAAGGAAVGVGIAFTIDYVINKTNQNSDALNNYGAGPHATTINNPCMFSGSRVTPTTQDGCSAQNNSQNAEVVMIATYIGGGVTAIVGLSLMLTAHTTPPPGHIAAGGWLSDVHVVPSVTPGQESLMVVGRF
jgi:hypothetical protein